MEINFRFILIIISVIVIGGIYLHGRIKIRKSAKNPYKLDASKADEVENDDVFEMSRAYDRDGFDQDGVGKVKPILLDDIDIPAEPPKHINNPPPIAEEELPEQSATMEDFERFEQRFTPVEANIDLQLKAEPVVANADMQAPEESKEAYIAVEPKTENVDDLLDMSAVTHSDDATSVLNHEEQHPTKTTPEQSQKDNLNAANEKPQASVSKKSKAELKRDQLEMDFDRISAGRKVEIEQEVLALSVVVNDNQVITGAALLPTLLTLGLKYGEMNIFHRHQDNAGNGKITFSVANMMNPGTFDLDNIETFVTKGITLFMTLPNANEPAKVFKQMLSAAKQIASEVEGQVLDGQRSMMTKQTEQHYMSKIREFDRRARLASA